MQWTVWGFAFWTLSMFTGELWSYLGWGTPVVWDDPAITTTMATWFFYICLLHLHLTGSWTARSRGVYTAAGALVVLVLNCVPELGPFRFPL
jgi:ABC-type transport system involved in cytochrome c biogenesis permease subunit